MHQFFIIDKDDKEKKEVPDQKVMSSSELDEYDYYMLNTEDKYYVVAVNEFKEWNIEVLESKPKGW